MGPCASNPLPKQDQLPYLQQPGMEIHIIINEKPVSRVEQKTQIIVPESAEYPMDSVIQKQNVFQTRINILNKILGQLYKVSKYSEQIRLVLTEKGRLHFQMMQYKQTIHCLKGAIEVFDKIYPSQKYLDYIGLYNNIGTAYGKLKKRKKARRYFIMGINCFFQFFEGKYHHLLTILLTNLAIYSKKKKEEDKKEFASEQFKKNKNFQVEEKPLKVQSIKVQIPKQGSSPNKSPELVEPKKYLINEKLLESLGLLEFKDGNFDGIDLFNKILDFSLDQNGQVSILSAKVYHNIANQYFLKKQYLRSQEIFLEAIRIKKSVTKQEDNYEVATSQIALAKCYFEQHKYYQGLKEYLNALKTFDLFRELPLFKDFVDNKLAKNIQKMIKDVSTKNYGKRQKDQLYQMILKYKLEQEVSFKWIIQSLKLNDYSFK